jgi:hypothetical protein
VTQQEVQSKLDSIAADMLGAAVLRLSTQPQGYSLVAMAMVINREDRFHVLALQQPQFRREILRSHGKTFGTIGFALLYDGRVYDMCITCEDEPNPECELCHGRAIEKVDAVVTVVRTAWGYSSTKHLCYGYDDHGLFKLLPEKTAHADAIMAAGRAIDNYDAVFREVTVQ